MTSKKRSAPQARAILDAMPWLTCAIAAVFAVYFPAAFRLRDSYVDRAPRGQAVFQIMAPFQRYGLAAVAREPGLDRFNGMADEREGDSVSPILVYEDDKPLGPAHSTFFDIYHLGAGRFSHLKDDGIKFSASDNSDPNTNGRHYWAVVPSHPVSAQAP